MLQTKTKEHLRRRAAIFLPHLGVLAASVAALVGAVAFTGHEMRVVQITDSHGDSGMVVTAAQDMNLLLAQTGIATPEQGDVIEVKEEEQGRESYHILRAYTVPLTADGKTQEVLTTGGTVADLLGQAGVTVGKNDLVEPALDTVLAEDTAITLRRVAYRDYTREEEVPVETQYRYSSLFYRKQSYTQQMQTGTPGVDAVSYRETYVDGALVSTEETRRETRTPMTPTIIKAYQEGAPVSQYAGPEIADGVPVTGVAAVYTGKRATGYSASATAKGASGRRLNYGTVAINPNSIPYGSLMYITSADGRFVYGYAYAADSGTAMMDGRAFIDLYYETYDESVDNAVVSVNIYVLDSETAKQYKEQNDALLAADTTKGL